MRIMNPMLSGVILKFLEGRTIESPFNVHERLHSLSESILEAKDWRADLQEFLRYISK